MGYADQRNNADTAQAGDTPSFIWRFADAELDEASWRLSVRGQPIELEPRPLQVLRELLRSAGEVVRKDELVEAVYGHQHVTDGALNQAISKLRSALGDRDQTIIATVHRLGYRLAAPVQVRVASSAQAQPVTLQVGGTLPKRDQWELSEPLGSNRGIEVWLAKHRKLGEQRVFKVSVDGARLSCLKREVTLYRMLSQQLGERDDFVKVLDWNFEQAPFYIECEFGGADLLQWWQAQNGAIGVPLQQRLQLVAAVADSIADAHAIGVLHKDLKPGNILIEAAGDGSFRTRVADFGSAHLLHLDRLAQFGITQLGFTQTHTQMASGGTPLYLAPEVIADGSATALSDVYALGVVLYQLVVGDLRKPLAPGWERDVPDEVLRGDIAAAVDGNPQRRLASARELAQRLRQLDARREDLRAQQKLRESAAETARQLDRLRARRPWVLTAVTALCLGLALGGWFYVDALNSGREAREQAAIAQAVTDFFSREVLSAAAPYEDIEKSNTPTVREAVDRALSRVGERFRDQPAIEAAIRATAGEVYGELTDLQAAIDQDRKALELFRASLGPDHPRTLQAQYWLSQDLTEASRFAEAAQLIAEADAMRAQIDADPRTLFAAHRARCYHEILTSDYERAVGDCEATLASQRQLDPNDQTALFKWLANLATLHSRMGRFEQANPLFAEGLATLRRDGSEDSLTGARFKNLYAINLVLERRYEQAEPLLREAYETMVAHNPANLYAHETLGLLAVVYARTGRLQEALAASRTSYENYLRDAGADSHFTALAEGLLGLHECEAGECDSGIAHLESARTRLGQQLGEQHPQTQRLQFFLARSLLKGRRPPEAVEPLLATLDAEALETASPERDWAPRLDLLRGRLLIAKGRDAEAAALIEPALARLRQLGSAQTEVVAAEQVLALRDR
ncbi:winged helix-turn-helix domain-containing protein [Steroidobacter sp. S1-65]|uniref:Winged helix-turn-helix domain-containing protein n=1 Tax=Steroidobacter gossypii TaxID=2805490 RepID=A0ABS1X0K1_9GAMM|nr:tetratricopeptide repeat protein [Steroidobacter gossypii]MBM0106707.1 winged helix-turn-helix domain-containing protein [Steroidobacter gossypii]